MVVAVDLNAPQNPFSTRQVRPGAVAYRFRQGQSAGNLVRRLENNAWRGQIVGPHGSGKSALLAALVPCIEERGRRTVLIELHDGQRRLPINPKRIKGLIDGTIIIVDGYEQLGFEGRWLLNRFCRRRKLGLLVTTHASAGFPDLCRTTASLPLADEIVSQLLGGESLILISPDELKERFTAHQGNMREILFDLYDLYEQRRRHEASGE